MNDRILKRMWISHEVKTGKDYVASKSKEVASDREYVLKGHERKQVIRELKRWVNDECGSHVYSVLLLERLERMEGKGK